MVIKFQYPGQNFHKLILCQVLALETLKIGIIFFFYKRITHNNIWDKLICETFELLLIFDNCGNKGSHPTQLCRVTVQNLDLLSFVEGILF